MIGRVLAGRSFRCARSGHVEDGGITTARSLRARGCPRAPCRVQRRPRLSWSRVWGHLARSMGRRLARRDRQATRRVERATVEQRFWGDVGYLGLRGGPLMSEEIGRSSPASAGAVDRPRQARSFPFRGCAADFPTSPPPGAHTASGVRLAATAGVLWGARSPPGPSRSGCTDDKWAAETPHWSMRPVGWTRRSARPETAPWSDVHSVGRRASRRRRPQ